MPSVQLPRPLHGAGSVLQRCACAVRLASRLLSSARHASTLREADPPRTVFFASRSQRACSSSTSSCSMAVASSHSRSRVPHAEVVFGLELSTTLEAMRICDAPRACVARDA